jgi:hydroxylaminobenzene mutase
MISRKRQLLRHGIFLFLLGLLTGLAVQALKNPRMGLSAHLEGLMNGTFLAVLGLLWSELRLSPRAGRAVLWLALYGAYANWASTLLAAAFGTSGMTPIAGAGHVGARWQELAVDFGLVSLSLAIIACCVIVLVGLRGAEAAHERPASGVGATGGEPPPG